MEGLAPTRGEYNMSVAKDRQHNSQAKSLLYGGGDDEPAHREGKRSVPQSWVGGAPFATYDAPAPGAAGQSRGARKDQQGASKVGAVEFDPAVYRANRAANAQNSAALKSKNWGSGQVMNAEQQAPAGPAPGQGGYGDVPQGYAPQGW